METMQQVVLIGHTLISVLIIILVLFQRGKGADAGAAFGAGASGTVFGARGSSNFFSRATGVLATAFFASSLTLAYMSSQRTTAAPESLLDEAPILEEQLAPVLTGTEDTAEEGDFPELPDPDATEPAAEESDMPALEPEEAGEDTGEQ